MISFAKAFLQKKGEGSDRLRGPIRKISAFMLAFVFFCTGLSLFAFAEEKPSFTLGVTTFAQNENTTVNLWFDEADGRMWLFLPSQSDSTSLYVQYAGTGSVSIDGTPLINGAVTDVFSVGEHTLVCEGAAYPLTVLRSADLPVVFLDTESGTLEKIQADKNHKETGRITVIENGNTVIDNAELKSVKGRGNSTWDADKKPYNIKFDKKTDVLGMGKAKKWSLLANHFDASLLRNSVALDLAKAFGLPFTPEYRMVDLYANGEYQGNYLIVESVEIGETRVAITDLEAANEDANLHTDVQQAQQKSESVGGMEAARKWVDITSPTDVTGGYLLECELPSRYMNEVSGFITSYGQRIVLKSPEYASREEVAYIADFYGEMEQALYSSDGYNAVGKHYTEYFDMDQLVKMYILTEYTFHRDAGMSSCYFYKDAGESVLHAGPAWDFDLSMGNTRYRANLPFDVSNPETWWANSVYCQHSEEKTQTVFTLLYRHEDFRALVSERWSTLSPLIDAELARLPQMTEATMPSAVMNACRWNLLSGKTPDEKKASYRENAEVLEKFAAARRGALDKGFGADGAMVYYDANGGSGMVFNGTMLSVGDSVVLREITHSVTPVIAPEGCVFAGWNTRPDGSGDLYRSGDEVPVTEKTTVFYAQWKTKNAVPSRPTEEDACYSLGDIDLDGNVSSADARLALRASVDLQNLDTLLRQLADADGDDTVSSADARLILRAAVKLESLPQRPVFIPAGHERPY